MIALVLTKDGYNLNKFPAIEDLFRNIPNLRKQVDLFPEQTYVAAFSNEGWLISDFGTEEQLLKIMEMYKEGDTNGNRIDHT